MSEFNDNIPVGADVKEAPWNEPLNIKHRRYVSLIISFDTEVEGPPDMREECIKESIERNIKGGIFPDKFDIDELVILKE